MPAGRPTDYTEDLGLSICAQLAEGVPLTRICKAEDMPSLTTVYRWLTEKSGFRDIYEKAREDQAHTMADQIISISDDGSNDTYIDSTTGLTRIDNDVIQRSKLRVDARKWVAARLLPRKYGDFHRAEVTGKDGGPLELNNLSDADLLKIIKEEGEQKK